MNRLKPVTLLVIFLITAVLAGCAPYERRDDSLRLDPETVSIPEYREFLVELNTAVEDDIPREFNSQEMDQFNRVSTRLDKLLAQHDTIDTMDEDQRVQLLNLHSKLEAVVIGKDDDQILCRREQRVGTHFRTTECRPVSEWREEQQRAQHFFSSGIRSTMEPPESM